MKRNIFLALLGFSLVGCSSPSTSSIAPSSEESSESATSQTPTSLEETSFITSVNDTHIIFFSRAGENWQVGNVEKGNTEVVVDYILEEYDFDSFKIEPLTPYPENYEEMLSVVREEQSTNARPDYLGEIQNFEDYENIILGYPIYNSTLPNIVLSLLDDYDFAGKTIYPFSTHGGSGLGNTISRLEELEPEATISSSFSISGSQVRNEGSKERVISWIESLPIGEYQMDQFENVTTDSLNSLSNKQKGVLNDYMTILQAMIDKDQETLETYVDENITIRHMTGATQTREEWIGEIINGELNYFSCQLSDINIAFNENDIATLTANSELEAQVHGYSRQVWSMHPNQSFEKRNGLWVRMS